MESSSFCPENLSVYGCEIPQVSGTEQQLSDDEIGIHRWLDEIGVVMSDPLDIVHTYFEKKKTQITAEKSRLLLKKPSNLWARRKEMAKNNLATSPDNSTKSSLSSDDGTLFFFD